MSGLLVLGTLCGCSQSDGPGAQTRPTDAALVKRQPKERPDPTAGVPKSRPGVTVELHRTGAGDPDDDGWCPAVSSHGPFSVKLPTTFTDFTMSVRATDGVDVTFDTIGTKTNTGTQYTAIAVRRADGKVPSDVVAKTGAEFGTEARERRPITQAGMSGVYFRVAGPDSTAMCRVFQSETTAYQLIVDHQAGTAIPPAVEKDAMIFFESFRLK